MGYSSRTVHRTSLLVLTSSYPFPKALSNSGNAHFLIHLLSNTPCIVNRLSGSQRTVDCNNSMSASLSSISNSGILASRRECWISSSKWLSQLGCCPSRAKSLARLGKKLVSGFPFLPPFLRWLAQDVDVFCDYMLIAAIAMIE